MADRKAELEHKKAKLLALREEKKKREETRKFQTYESDATNTRQVTEDLLKNLGVPDLPQILDQGFIETDQLLTDTQNVTSRSAYNTRKQQNLKICEVTEVSILPPERIVYSKDTQTVDEQPNDKENRSTDYYVLTYDENGRDDVDANAALAELEKMPHVGGLIKSSSTNIQMLKSYDRIDFGLDEEAAKKIIPVLSEDEKLQILSSEEFAIFFERSSRIIEKALTEHDADITFNYACVEPDLEETSERLTVVHKFFDERWSKRRTVTSLDWSPNFPELLLGAYYLNEDISHEPEGACLIWNMKYPKKSSPEFIFHCQSPVTSAALSRFHPNIVVGGTYSGQVVLWDSRVNKRTPIQRTPLTSWAHIHPVFAISVVGTQNAHNIISLGSDGSLCAWNMEMLAQPREKTKIREISSTGSVDVYPTCMSFLANDVNNYAVGAENGNAYCGQRHSSRTGGSEESVHHVPYTGHVASVTAISTHPSPGAVSFSSFFLTASLDWTVRLWSTRENKPLHTFDDYSDYVYDVCWSPTHPAVFAAVDEAGHLDVWNINEDSEVPVARRTIGGPSSVENNVSRAALNKCCWNNSGTHLAVGDNMGHLTVCSVSDGLSQPNSDEWTAFAHSLAELKHYSMDSEIKAEA